MYTSAAIYWMRTKVINCIAFKVLNLLKQKLQNTFLFILSLLKSQSIGTSQQKTSTSILLGHHDRRDDLTR